MENDSGGGGGLVAKSCPTLVTPWTAACQAPLLMGFSRQEYQSGLPFPSPGDLPDPWMEPRSPALQADSLPTELQGRSQNAPKDLGKEESILGSFLSSSPNNFLSWICRESVSFVAPDCGPSLLPTPLLLSSKPSSAEITTPRILSLSPLAPRHKLFSTLYSPKENVRSGVTKFPSLFLLFS